VLVPSGEATGGQGLPVGVVPGVPGVAELLWLFPEVEGDERGLEDPAFGVEPGAVSGVTQGVPIGVVGLGSVVDGCVLLFGVGVVGEVGLGTVVVGGGVVGVAELPGGVVVVPGGVAVLLGGVAGLPGGVAVPGVWVCPAVPGVPEGGAPPEGAICATTQIA
jgi:hypothetical protein